VADSRCGKSPVKGAIGTRLRPQTTFARVGNAPRDEGQISDLQTHQLSRRRSATAISSPRRGADQARRDIPPSRGAKFRADRKAVATLRRATPSQRGSPRASANSAGRTCRSARRELA